jgi:hypothetical protein
MYGDIKYPSQIQSMVEGYVFNNIPIIASQSSFTLSRTRYVFAITIGQGKTGEPLVQARPSRAKKLLDDQGYIGNIGTLVARLLCPFTQYLPFRSDRALLCGTP